MNSEKIKYIERIYTGGGIFVYRGITTAGRYFIAESGFVAEIVNDNVLRFKDWEFLDDPDWYDAVCTNEDIMDTAEAWRTAETRGGDCADDLETI